MAPAPTDPGRTGAPLPQPVLYRDVHGRGSSHLQAAGMRGRATESYEMPEAEPPFQPLLATAACMVV